MEIARAGFAITAEYAREKIVPETDPVREISVDVLLDPAKRNVRFSPPVGVWASHSASASVSSRLVKRVSTPVLSQPKGRGMRGAFSLEGAPSRYFALWSSTPGRVVPTFFASMALTGL